MPTIYKATTLDGMFRVAVVEFRSGWRVYSRMNNGRTETMPFPRTHHTEAEVIAKARRAYQIFTPLTDAEVEAQIDEQCKRNPAM